MINVRIEATMHCILNTHIYIKNSFKLNYPDLFKLVSIFDLPARLLHMHCMIVKSTLERRDSIFQLILY